MITAQSTKHRTSTPTHPFSHLTDRIQLNARTSSQPKHQVKPENNIPKHQLAKTGSGNFIDDKSRELSMNARFFFANLPIEP
jgi:hypothetical protein